MYVDIETDVSSSWVDADGNVVSNIAWAPIDGGPGAAISDVLRQVMSRTDFARMESQGAKARALSIAYTNLEQALLWLRQSEDEA